MTDLSAPKVYCLRVQLVDSEPAIWRRFCIDAQLPLQALHSILAAVMGWSGTADFRFGVKRQSIASVPLATTILPPETPLVRVLLQPGDTLLYTYNSQQGWLHKVWLETVEPAGAASTMPYCLAGERNCPPETCGGVWGYEELIDRLSDPDDPAYDQLWETVGEDFDPDWFDLQATNQRLVDLQPQSQ